jgi:thiol:disulfide interchange protein
MLRIAIPVPADMPVTEAYFFPGDDGVIAYAAPQTVRRLDDLLIVEARLAGGTPEQVKGVLRIDNGDKHSGLALTAVRGTVPAGGAAIGGGIDAQAGGGGPGAMPILLALAGAIVGGLLLNIMPCVFPILSLKALSLARAGESEAMARREALAYTAGVVLICLALGAALLGLRASGAAAGWAFQLQDPRVILLLLLLVTAVGLNLAGLFELGAFSAGGRLAAKGGTAGAFWTGTLAAFVATPCTGPFMGAALGAALVLPAPAALAVFGGLGVGLALPFLLLGFVPALRARLPRPGPWMERFRNVMAVPMLLTALGLAWVLGRQAGVDGMTLGLAAALVLALALWWVGRRQSGARRHAWLPVMPAAVAAIVAVATVAPQATPRATATAPAFSEPALAALRAEGRPVFVYFTADWCVTCKINEKTAIERSEVRGAFDRADIAVLVGDWTNGDGDIGRFLASHGRSGVPLYLFYPPGGDAQVLPQLLTPGMLTALAD